MKLISRIAKLRAAGIAATAQKTLPGRQKERRKPAGKDRAGRPRDAAWQ